MSLEKNTSHRTGGCSTENARRKKTCSVFLPPRCSLSIAFYVPQRPEPMLRIFLLRHKQLFSKIHGVSSNKNTTHRTGACSTENARRKKTCSVFLFSRRSTKAVLCDSFFSRILLFPGKKKQKKRSRGSLFA